MASPDEIRSRYIHELLGAASVLASVESAAVAEAWASGAVAEWAALEGAPGQLAKRLGTESPFASALIEWMEGGELPTGEAEWIADVGQHTVTRAVQILHGDGDEVGIIFEYTAPSDDRHDLSVTVVGGAIAGVAVGPEGLADAAVEDDREGLRVTAITEDEAMAIVREALASPIGELSAAAEATVPLLIQRVGLVDDAVAGFAASSAERVLPDRDGEDDRYAADLVKSALRIDLGEPPPAAVLGAHEAFLHLIEAGDPDALTVFDIAGIDPGADGARDVDTFVRLVGAYLAPQDLRAHTDPQFGALIELEPADWIGVILTMARSAVGTSVDGDTMVRFINKAPEITTSIPKTDAPRLAWTFEQMLYAWQVTGVLDADGAVSEAARWLLPRAAIAAWTSPTT